MEADADSLRRAKRRTLYAVALATVAMVTVLVTPATFTIRDAAALLGVWLLFASLIRYAALRRRLLMPMFRRPIPIRFSGNLGRFTLLVRGDGRRVQVRAGADVVAEAVATDERDELVVDLEEVDDAELDALGAAIGAAIEMVAVADQDRSPERRGARVHGGGDARPRATTAALADLEAYMQASHMAAR
ncbi:MAG: hypothetical protein M3P32_06930 [Chloroflexota bacterium]|nr:hypothetical protein [Chloroflexota bacterium]